MVFSRSRSAGRGPSAPEIRSRSSSTHRTTCAGEAVSRITADRLPSRFRIFAGMGSVSAKYVLLNQKCRASDRNSVEVGIAVATMTRRVRNDPRSEEHTSELQSRRDLVCRLLLEKKKK